MSEDDQMMTTGSLVLDTEIDGEVYELRFHVVRRKDFKVKIGNGMLKKAAIAIEGSDARFKKLPNNEEKTQPLPVPSPDEKGGGGTQTAI